MAIPNTMKAWQYSTHGEPSVVLELVDNRPVPPLRDSQVLVHVRCAALNPVGYKTMMHMPSFVIKKPAVPEMDLSGVVVALGKSVIAFKLGDEVYGIIPGEVEMRTGVGAMSHYTAVEASDLVHKGQNLSWQEAASIPLVAETCYECLVDIGNLRSGQSVFVNGGSGGVGTAGVQIAKALGAYVVASCSAQNMEFVKGLGADEVVDYRAVDLATHLVQHYSDKKFDIILDGIGSDPLYKQCEAYLNTEGVFIQVGAPTHGVLDSIKLAASMLSNMLWPGFLGGVSRKFKFMLLTTSKDKLEAINRMVEEGKYKAVVDSVHEFENAKAAYERIMTNRARGKVVVNVTHE